MQNLQMVEVKYLGATNIRGGRVKLIDTRFNVSITMARNYEDTADEQAIKYLQNQGFNIVAKTCDEKRNQTFLLIDNFEPINTVPYKERKKCN